jgi:hypothetical protein
MTEATLERLNDDTRLTRRDRLNLHNARLQKFCDGSLHCRLTLPELTGGN